MRPSFKEFWYAVQTWQLIWVDLKLSAIFLSDSKEYWTDPKFRMLVAFKGSLKTAVKFEAEGDGGIGAFPVEADVGVCWCWRSISLKSISSSSSMDCELLKTPEFGKDEGPPPTTKFGVLENKQVEGVRWYLHLLNVNFTCLVFQAKVSPWSVSCFKTKHITSFCT